MLTFAAQKYQAISKAPRLSESIQAIEEGSETRMTAEPAAPYTTKEEVRLR